MAKRADPAALVAGLMVAGFGVVLLLDATGAFQLRFAALGPIAAFMVGATLLASGLSRRG
ncbi:MAG: hypothetical protein ACJ77Z_20955 [Thermoleophilaceae bacterium]